MSEKIYGVADKAWQCVVGCDPHMPCAPRCWARKTVARIVECQKPQNPDRAEFFQIALTPDGKEWSGKTYLDEAHLLDPLKWRKPAIIATGFHGDWGRLEAADMDRILAVMAMCPQHKFMPLSKQPNAIVEYFGNSIDVRRRVSKCLLDSRVFTGNSRTGNPSRVAVSEGILHGWRPLVANNVTFGCSVMNQTEANKYRSPMARLANLELRTHVWYEPAIGPVDWKGWEFLTFIISGGESGAKARPSHPQWHRDTLDFCFAHGVEYNLKQHGEWLHESQTTAEKDHSMKAFTWPDNSQSFRIGKRNSGRLLDGREWNGVPFPQ